MPSCIAVDCPKKIKLFFQINEASIKIPDLTLELLKSEKTLSVLIDTFFVTIATIGIFTWFLFRIDEIKVM